MTGSSAPRAAMAGSTAPGLAAGEERLRMLAVKRAKRWVSGCGAVELVMPAVLLKLLLLRDVEEGRENWEVNEEAERERKFDADAARVAGLCCFGCGDLLGERGCCCCCCCCFC